jgi:hypothetical protein
MSSERWERKELPIAMDNQGKNEIEREKKEWLTGQNML